jgi:hypothetical protein
MCRGLPVLLRLIGFRQLGDVFAGIAIGLPLASSIAPSNGRARTFGRGIQE